MGSHLRAWFHAYRCDIMEQYLASKLHDRSNTDAKEVISLRVFHMNILLSEVRADNGGKIILYISYSADRDVRNSTTFCTLSQSKINKATSTLLQGDIIPDVFLTRQKS